MQDGRSTLGAYDDARRLCLNRLRTGVWHSRFALPSFSHVQHLRASASSVV